LAIGNWRNSNNPNRRQNQIRDLTESHLEMAIESKMETAQTKVPINKRRSFAGAARRLDTCRSDASRELETKNLYLTRTNKRFSSMELMSSQNVESQLKK
jgi:hypothetical protein